MNKIVIHIGTHKTGSTSFQKTLDESSTILSKLDARVVRSPVYWNGLRIPKSRISNVYLANYLLRSELKFPSRIRAKVPLIEESARDKELARFARSLSKFSEKTLIISAEDLCYLRTEDEKQRLREFLQIVGREVQTIVLFRENESWRKSMTQQIERESEIVKSDIFVKHDSQSILGEWYFDKCQIREFWSEFNLQELSYEKSKNVVESIFAEIGIDHQRLKTDVRLNSSNQ